MNKLVITLTTAVLLSVIALVKQLPGQVTAQARSEEQPIPFVAPNTIKSM